MKNRAEGLRGGFARFFLFGNIPLMIGIDWRGRIEGGC